MSLAQDYDQGVLFKPQPFLVKKERANLSSGQLALSEPELEYLRSLQGTETLVCFKVFAAVQGYKVAANELTWNLVISDATIDQDS